MRPASLISSISRLLLIVIIKSSKRFFNFFYIIGDGALRVDIAQQAAPAIIFKQRFGLLPVYFQTTRYGLAVVIEPLKQRRAAIIANIIYRWFDVSSVI